MNVIRVLIAKIKHRIEEDKKNATHTTREGLAELFKVYWLIPQFFLWFFLRGTPSYKDFLYIYFRLIIWYQLNYIFDRWYILLGSIPNFKSIYINIIYSHLAVLINLIYYSIVILYSAGHFSSLVVTEFFFFIWNRYLYNPNIGVVQSFFKFLNDFSLSVRVSEKIQVKYITYFLYLYMYLYFFFKWLKLNKSLICIQFAFKSFYLIELYKTSESFFLFHLNYFFSYGNLRMLEWSFAFFEESIVNAIQSSSVGHLYIESISIKDWDEEVGFLRIEWTDAHMLGYSLATELNESWMQNYFMSQLTAHNLTMGLVWPYLSFGIDGISIFFLLLSTWLICTCYYISWNNVIYLAFEYNICFFLLGICLIIAFFTTDLLIFYVAFESVLIPMFFIVGIWGSRTRKIKAAYQFFLYTLFGSVFLLLAIIIINYQFGTTDLEILLLSGIITYQRQLILWWAFFFSFAIKVPMIPVHIWLPEAHVEAPTSGSIILAGILLKLGTYGFIRYTIPLLPYASMYYSIFVFTLSIIGIIYSSLTTIRQNDLKKIIAYSSVAHMNFVTLGIFTLNIYGLEGAILLMLSHGFVSSALFFSIGILYDRYHSRTLRYYSGLVMTMPVFSIFFFHFILANLSMPSTGAFIGEFLIFIGTLEQNTTIVLFASLSILLSAGYSIWLYNRLIFGIYLIPYKKKEFWFKDVNLREFKVLLMFSFIITLMGLYPNLFLGYLHMPCSQLLITYLF